MKDTLLVLLLALAASSASASTVEIFCDGNDVGTVDLAITLSHGDIGLSGGFATPIGSLAAAAAVCGEDHFNWHQRVIADNMPPVDAAGHRLVPPFDDPPQGGYGNDPNTPGDETQWADNFPWYWDEGPDPPPDTPGFKSGYNRRDNEPTGSLLHFEDFPSGPDGTTVTFELSLVSLNADNSLHSSHTILEWTYIDKPGPTRPTVIVPEPENLAFAASGMLLIGILRRFGARC